MTPSLEDIKGLGTKIDTLKEAGIDSVEKLSNSKIEELTKLKGIGKATAEKYINNAKDLIKESESSGDTEEKSVETTTNIEEEEKIQEELKKLEEKKKNLQGKKVEEGDFILLKITSKTQKGRIFRVSSVEDAKKAGIYKEENEKQGQYSPDFVIVGKPGFLNEGLTEIVKNMNYFEKKSVRIPPTKAFGKREPQKIERIGIAKFRKLNEGKNPELGQEFVKQGPQGNQRGSVVRISQGKVMIDYNHPLAGQSIDYNLEVIDKIEEFNEKIEYFIINKGIPKESISEFNINYNKDDKSIEFTIPKMFLFQNLTYVKFGIAMDLQAHLADEINDVRFVEIYEKMAIPAMPSESIDQKVEEFNKEQETEISKEQEEVSTEKE